MKIKFLKQEAVTFTKSVINKYGVGETGIVDEILSDNKYRIKSAGTIIDNVPEEDLASVHSGTSKQVDDILREREQSKEFKDSDIRVGGTRKEMMAYKGLITASDLNDLEKKDSILARKLVNKNKVYPEINIQEEIEKDTYSGTLYLKVKMREACGNNPPDSSEARALYVGYIQYMFDLMSGAKTIDEFKDKAVKITDYGLRQMLIIANPLLEEEIIKQQSEFEQHFFKLKEYQITQEILSKKLVDKYGMFWQSEYKNFGIEESDKELVEQYKYWSNLVKATTQFSNGKMLPIETAFAKRIISESLNTHLSAKYVCRGIIESVFGATFMNFLIINSDAAVKKYSQAFLYEKFTQADYDQKYTDKIHGVEKRIDELTSWIAFLSDPTKGYKEKVDYALETARMGSWALGKKTFKSMVEKGDANAAMDFVKTMSEWEGRGFRSMLYDQRQALVRLNEMYKVRENDYSWTTEKKETKKSEKTTDLVINKGVPLSYIKRVGGVAVFNSDLDTGDKVLSFYKDVLGITGVTYGQTLPDDERGAHAKHYSGAILDLASILDYDVKEMIGIGNLKITFAASGHGGAAATFHPDTISINLTRRKGDGTVAHEVGHYFDKAIENMFPKDRVSIARHAPYTSFYNANNVSNFEIFKAMRGLMHFIKDGVAINKDFKLTSIYDQTIKQLGFNMFEFPYVSKELNDSLKPLFEDFIKEVVQKEIFIEIKQSKTRVVAKINLDNAETIEAALEFARQKYPTYFNYVEYNANKYVKPYFEAILNTYKIEKYKIAFKNNPIRKHSVTNNYNTSTAFYLNSQAMSSDYWTFDWELFARGFETYVAQKQIKLGRENNYLVSGAYFDRPEGVYPVGIERDILYILYENLFAVIKKELAIKDFVPFREERVNEYTVLGDNDKEKNNLTVDSKTDVVLEATNVFDEVSVIDKLREDWAKIFERLSVKKTFEEGGEINPEGFVNNLFKFANAAA